MQPISIDILIVNYDLEDLTETIYFTLKCQQFVMYLDVVFKGLRGRTHKMQLYLVFAL